MREGSEKFEGSLIDTSASFGHYEFIDWVIKGKRISDVDNILFGVMSSASCLVREELAAMNLEVMKTVFCHGLSADVMFPVGSKTP